MDRSITILVSGPNYEGFLVLDSVYQQKTSGGVRIAPDLQVDEIRDLAREMSFKYALFRLPRGGAKAGICLPTGLPASERLIVLEDFGRRLAPIIQAGLYYPGMDINCGPDDLRAIYRGAGIQIGAPTDTSYFTAITVANAMEACREVLAPGARWSVGIEGYGSVASHLTSLLDPSWYAITALSTVSGGVENTAGFDPRELVEKKRSLGDDLVFHLQGGRLDRSAVLTAPVDVLLPSSRTHVVTSTIAEQIRARCVVPIANAPYAAGAEEILSRRGVLILPGYLSNSGGVFASSLFDSGVPATEIEHLFRNHFRRMVWILLKSCRERGASPVKVAHELASAQVRVRESSPLATHSFAGPVRAMALRRLPRRVRRSLARRRALASLRAIEADISELEKA